MFISPLLRSQFGKASPWEQRRPSPTMNSTERHRPERRCRRRPPMATAPPATSSLPRIFQVFATGSIGFLLDRQGSGKWNARCSGAPVRSKNKFGGGVELMHNDYLRRKATVAEWEAEHLT